MIDYSILNDRQKEAMLCVDGPLLILAGAGSGKTRVLTYRIAYLINERGVKPSRILALTFTNKAANEMKERLAKLGVDVSELWVGTFHSICARILRVYSGLVGYSSSFSIYDTSDQYSLIRQIMKNLNISDNNLKVSFVKSMISDAKNKFISPSKYLSLNSDNYQLSKVGNIYLEYDRRLKECNSMDFDDLLLKTIVLFKNNENVLNYYRGKFKYVSVDEYQDTNLIQYMFVRDILNDDNNVCVVGDNDQSIYGWRGADIRNIIEFEKDYEGAKVVLLEQNYRSTQKILDLANSIIENNSDRRDKKLWTENSEGNDIIYCTSTDDTMEAEFVAKKIQEGVKRGDKYEDFAILYRTNAQSERFESVFNRKSIPYKIIGGLKFYDRKEVKDLLSYIKFIVNPSDESAFVRIINEPKRGIGLTSVSKILNIASTNNLNYMQALKYILDNNSLGKKTLVGIKEFYDIYEPYFREDLELPLPSDILKTIIEKTKYEENILLENFEKAVSKKENMDELVSQIMNYEVSKTIEENNSISNRELLSTYMQDISLVSDADNIPEQTSQVLMMTLHTAKGLEYENVFLVGMEDAIFPSQMAIDNDGLEEERRLCYVGITRAMKQLYMTRAFSRRRYGRIERNKESRFIDEMDLKDVKNIRFSSEQPLNKFSSNGSYNGSDTGYNNLSNSYFSNDIQTKTKMKTGFGVSVDNFVKSLESKENRKKIQEPKFEIGARVKHSIFGKGEVIDILYVDDEIDLVINFDKKGEKRLSQKMANLKNIE